MPSFPTLSSGSVAKYPVVRRERQRTRIFTFTDLSEQRFAMGSPLAEFDLTYNNVSTADKEAVRDFFNARKGAFDTSWDLTLVDKYIRSQDVAAATGERQNWDHLQFLPGSVFEAMEIKPGRWQFTLRIRQTRNN